MAKAKRAYFVDGERYTPSALRRASKARQFEAMIEWFGDHYEDPANRTPYESREGGYQWIWGGPYDADEELQEEFSDIVDYEVIQAAVEAVTGEGIYEWAPVASDDDYDPIDEGVESGEVADGEGEWPPLAGVPAEDRDLRSELIGRLDRIEEALRTYVASRERRNHNHPPGLVEDDDPLGEADLSEIERAVSGLREEASKADADGVKVQSHGASLGAAASKLWKVAKVVGEIGGIAGAVCASVEWAYAHQADLYGALVSAAETATEWGQHLNDFWM